MLANSTAETVLRDSSGLNKKSRRRYLIILNEVGFLYSHFWALARALQRAGWHVMAAGRDGAGGERALQADMEFYPVDLTIGIQGPLAELRSISELNRVIRDSKPDLIHLVSLKNVLVGGTLARLHRVPSVLGAITGLGTMFVEDKLTYSILRPMVISGLKFVFGYARSVMALENADDRDFFVEKGVIERERTIVVPGAGVASDAIQPSNGASGRPVILCVSRMIRNKGILQLIEAAQILSKEGVVFELQLVGDIDQGNPTSLSRDELRAAEQNSCIRWLGPRSDVPDLLRDAAIFCLPTYYREGLPRALVEAAAAGRAIVTTDMPGCRDIVRNGVNGYLVPAKNVRALANALASLLSNPQMCQQMGRESRRTFEQGFTQRSVLNAFNNCYEALNVGVTI